MVVVAVAVPHDLIADDDGDDETLMMMLSLKHYRFAFDC